MLDTLVQFNLVDKITSEAYPNLFAWKNLIESFHVMRQLSWPDTEIGDGELAQKIESIFKALKQETEDEGESRREKQRWAHYVKKEDKRPEDEFYDLS